MEKKTDNVFMPLSVFFFSFYNTLNWSHKAECIEKKKAAFFSICKINSLDDTQHSTFNKKGAIELHLR